MNSKQKSVRVRGIRTDVTPLIGKKYDKLTIIKKVVVEGNKHTFVQCLCDCGNYLDRKLSDLMYHHSKGFPNRCMECFRVSKSKKCGILEAPYFNNIKQGAKARKLKLSIDMQYCNDLWERQEGFCAISGVKLEPPRKIRYKNNEGKEKYMYTGTGSLDRIDSTKGYVDGNVQWVHKDVNLMKMGSNQEEFISWCFTIANYNRSKNEKEKAEKG